MSESITLSTASLAPLPQSTIPSLILLLSSLLFCSANSFAQGSGQALNIAVASNFRSTMQTLLDHFRQQIAHEETGTINLSSASTGKLVTQLLHGAPYALILAADDHSIDALVKKGLVREHERFVYALGGLALWHNKASDTSPLSAATPRFGCLAIANAKLAPYGQAAEQVIRRQQILSARLIRGQSVSQVYQFVASGNCEAGLLALSQLKANAIPSSQWLSIPPNWHDPIRQEAALLHGNDANAQALALWQFLKSAEASRIIEQAGYRLATNE